MRRGARSSMNPVLAPALAVLIGLTVAGEARAQNIADSTAASIPQRDIMDVFRGLTGRSVNPEPTLTPRPGLSLTLLPSIGYNPAYGAFIGVSAAFAGWLGDPSTTTTSSGSAGASYSTTGQISVQFKS